MSNHDPSSSWAPTISTDNPMYRSVSCSTHETSLPERGTAIDEMCPLYSAPNQSSQALSLDAVCRLQPNHFGHAKSKRLAIIDKDCNFSISGALLVLSVLGILLSGTVIVLCFLLSRGVISLATNYSIVTTVSDSSCQCEGMNAPDILLHLEQELEDIQHQMSLLQSKIPVSKSETVKKTEKFLAQTEAMSDAMEKKLSSYQVPVLEVSGLSFPAQITIDGLNKGCTHKVEEVGFTTGPPIASHEEYPYMNSTHIVTDILCMFSFNEELTLQGIASNVVSSETKSANLGIIHTFLSTAQTYCLCVYWGKPATKDLAICRRTLTLCPYTSQSFNFAVKNI